MSCEVSAQQVCSEVEAEQKVGSNKNSQPRVLKLDDLSSQNDLCMTPSDKADIGSAMTTASAASFATSMNPSFCPSLSPQSVASPMAPSSFASSPCTPSPLLSPSFSPTSSLSEKVDPYLRGPRIPGGGRALPFVDQQKDTEAPVLTIDALPKRILLMEYAVRGPVVTRSAEVTRDLKRFAFGESQLDSNPYPFDDLVFANIGNPQSVGQKPLTFNRQVLSCLINPGLLNHTDPFFPADVLERASLYLNSFPSFGSYSHSKGVPLFRQMVSEWLHARDGFDAPDPETIFMTDGASQAIRMVLEMLVRNENDGIMIPIPQYPLYSATITRIGGRSVHYYLQEDDGWALTMPELQRSIDDARQSGVCVRAVCVINPGNPTGSMLSKQQMQNIIRFCERERLVLLADEVYQDNIYQPDVTPFISFRKVALEMNTKVELASFHSSSKGLTGECGVRGGFVQMHNVSKSVLDVMYKLSSVSLCSNTLGQAMVTTILSAPREGDPSYEKYAAERSAIFSSLQRKAKYIQQRFNAMPGVSCQPILGAMYSFPRIEIPEAAIALAKKRQISPDLFYCLEMIERAGIVTVPGSGFGQKEGTYHYRMTILPSEDHFPAIVDRLEAFHNDFLKRYES